ncbi:LacI family DNA-binding transcriptional regulator [Solirubrobacter soli]|uniref:LacI family DNA-binding transcriptional regulator n=1 Tax=Solirubrobacter soli TaxID=363832 RepID=UPI00055F6D34|nr:LacI family DNA-binding transcriptional regulator [Solirubrobacter soli]
MSRNRPTLLDVARAAGVSRSTVSYAYNQPNRLSDETRARVLAAAREVGYAGPDPLAASLRRGRTGAIGVLFTEKLSYAFDDPGAVLFLRGVASAAENADVALTLLPVPPRGEGAPPGAGALAAVRGSAVDGVIVFSLPPEHAAVRAAVERRLPIVRVDMDAPPGEPVVRIDDRGGARAVAEHVLAQGHRRVAVLVDRLLDDDVRGLADARRRYAATFAVSRERLKGYDDAGLGGVPVFECAGNTIEDGRSAAQELLATPDPPTALLCITDQLARGALRAGDIAVTGFDDLPEAAASDLTTVHQDHIAKGAHAARMLLDPDAPREVTLPTRLVVRGSSARAPTRDGR